MTDDEDGYDAGPIPRSEPMTPLEELCMYAIWDLSDEVLVEILGTLSHAETYTLACSVAARESTGGIYDLIYSTAIALRIDGAGPKRRG